MSKYSQQDRAMKITLLLLSPLLNPDPTLRGFMKTDPKRVSAQ